MNVAARAPYRIGLYWMLGTFVAWLLLGDTSGLDDMSVLVAFVLIATGTWAWGYRHGVRTFPMEALQSRYGEPVANEQRQVEAGRRWVLWSGVYFVLYGWQMLLLYGATPQTFWKVVSDPGQAYAAKFETIEGLSTQTGNTLLQVLIVGSLLQLPLGPLLGYFWDQLSIAVRVTALAGFVSYAAFFLYIGTLQGLGFLLIGLAAGLLARQHRTGTGATVQRARRIRRRVRIVLTIGLTLFTLYMVNAQAGRLDAFDVKDQYQPNPTIEAIAGRDFARGLAVTVHYPTHGYRGLAYNLDTFIETPWIWTEGRGASRAIDSYWEQYFGTSVFKDTYPARTETLTGWSATIHWATVYPWLASDLTFPGAVVLMFFLGRWTARMWLRTIFFHDPLALMLFSQLALFVAFISVNNQVLISRPALIAVVSCLLLYFTREVVERRRGSELGRQVEVPVRVI